MEPDLLKYLIERTSYINTYWNFYIVVATAIFGLLASGKIALTKQVRVIITVAFLLFAFSNIGAILNVNTQRRALINLILENSANYKSITDTFKPNHWLWYTFFHLCLDVSILLAIWKFKIAPDSNAKYINE